MTVEALRRGEPAVLADLLERYGREIQGVAYLILRDRSEAEDVLMDTLVTALGRASDLRDPAALRPWLIRIATNHALGRRRRALRLVRGAVLPEVAAAAPDSAQRIVILGALDGLPPRTRAAVVLHYYADLSVTEVAATMGTSPNTVKTQLRQALDRLRTSLAEREAPAATSEAVHG